MLFGRSPKNESIPLPELEAYLGRCFDGKLKRLATRLPGVEGDLSESFADFERAVKKFSESSESPDMDYLYGVKETSMGSQKANYSSSLLHLLASPPKYSSNGVYFKAKELLESYSLFTTDVMKTNNTFKLVMIGYAKDLAEVKRHFTLMEKFCNDLRSEISLCIPDEAEYSKIKSRIMAMMDNVSEIKSLQNPTQRASNHTHFDESSETAIRKQIEEKESHLGTVRHQYHEAESVLVNLLLPVERVARKHDHLSASKKHLSDYMKNPSEQIRTLEDGKIIHDHLTKIVEEIKENKIDTKHPETLISQIDSIRSSDLISLASSVRDSEAEAKTAEAELSELRMRLQAFEMVKSEKQKLEAGKARTEQEISSKQTYLASEKKELERLFLNCYKKNIEIVLSSNQT